MFPSWPLSCIFIQHVRHVPFMAVFMCVVPEQQCAVKV